MLYQLLLYLKKLNKCKIALGIYITDRYGIWDVALKYRYRMADFVDQVEQAMTRMFDPSTSNAEKQSIEQQLQTFKKGETKYGLRQCYHMLTLRWAFNLDDAFLCIFVSSKNQYVLWFASSMLEEIVQKRWKTMSPTDQSNLSQFVIEQLLSNAFTLPPFVFTKLAVGKFIS